MKRNFEEKRGTWFVITARFLHTYWIEYWHIWIVRIILTYLSNVTRIEIEHLSNIYNFNIYSTNKYGFNGTLPSIFWPDVWWKILMWSIYEVSNHCRYQLIKRKMEVSSECNWLFEFVHSMTEYYWVYRITRFNIENIYGFK